ncbi:MAG TPA: phage holin family protein [Bryobacteraceae bacterium]|jgi:putative membrane protein|nr:phage holin family protein [Bryobacteraceae bacterium]
MLLHAILNWFLGALALWLVARIVPGIYVRDFGAALIATIIIGIVDAIVGPVLKFFGLPFIILTLGLFLLVINAALLKLASLFTPGFEVHGFIAAVLGSVVLTVLDWVLRRLVYVRI